MGFHLEKSLCVNWYKQKKLLFILHGKPMLSTVCFITDPYKDLQQPGFCRFNDFKNMDLLLPLQSLATSQQRKMEQKWQAGFRCLWVQWKEHLEVSVSETAQFTEALSPVYMAQVRGEGRMDKQGRECT